MHQLHAKRRPADAALRELVDRDAAIIRGPLRQAGTRA
jgi:hypothetical protein